MTKPPQMFDVTAGTRAALCSSCNKTIFWILTPKGKRMPVDCQVEGAQPPAAQRAGRAVSHFITCPNAGVHRRPR